MHDLTLEEAGLLRRLWLDRVKIERYEVMAAYGLTQYKARQLLTGLRNKGYIKLITNVINGDLHRENVFTNKTKDEFARTAVGFYADETQPVEFLPVENLPIGKRELVKTVSTYGFIKEKNGSEASEKENENYEVRNMSPDPLLGSARSKSDWELEQAEAFAKNKFRKQQEAKEAHDLKVERLFENKRNKRLDTDLSKWTATDVFFWFMDECRMHWNIKTSAVNKTAFLSQLQAHRLKYDTDATFEIPMFTLLFGQINPKKFPDADSIWKFYIYQYSTLLSRVKLSKVSPDEEKQYQDDMQKQFAAFKKARPKENDVQA
jgi:hypothetical protein